MSTGKRLAKRSILGTRVCAPDRDGIFQSGIITSTKTESDDRESAYYVLFEGKKTGEYKRKDLIGPGFQQVTSVKLQQKQKVYVTYNGREVCGSVLNHNYEADEVVISIQPSAQNHNISQPTELIKRLDEVRLLESRKSARLQDQDTDYSRLAEGQTEPRRRADSLGIDVPSSQNGRKRRPSAASEDATTSDVMDDCMAAAMVLMSLSCSPKSPKLPDSGPFSQLWTSSASSGASSWDSASSLNLRTGTPSPPGPLHTPSDKNSARSSSPNSQDDGIETDDSSGFLEDKIVIPAKRKASTSRVVFQCTWPKCSRQYYSCSDIEQHVRVQHLGKTSNRENDSDHEEEFYYTEIEVEEDRASPFTPLMHMSESAASPSSTPSIFTSFGPTLSHLDMVRPPHEDPEYIRQMQQSSGLSSSASPITIPQVQRSVSWQPHHAYAASAPSATVSPQKYMRLSPKTLSSSLKSSPIHKRTRSESRKCRKVYGMENRDMWCTQCKWKKACTRFVD